MPPPRRISPPSPSDRFGVPITRGQLDALLALAAGSRDPDVTAFLALAATIVGNRTDPEFMRCCESCGALNVQIAVWVYVNTNEIADRDAVFDEAHCSACNAPRALDDLIRFYELDEPDTPRC